MFGRETRRFDEVGGRSFMIGEGSDGQGIVGVWGESGCVTGGKESWRLLDPVGAAKRELVLEEEGKIDGKRRSYQENLENFEVDDTLQRFFKGLLIGISKFSNPPIRKMAL
jgi:hypothetical protein